MAKRRAIFLLPQRLAVCRLQPGTPVPGWALSGAFCSVTRTPGELSVVCAQTVLPAGEAAGLRVERGFRAFRVQGPLDFEQTGVLAGLLDPLARAGIPVLALSTFDTDYLLVREERAEEARRVLGRIAEVRREGSPPKRRRS